MRYLYHFAITMIFGFSEFAQADQNALDAELSRASLYEDLSKAEELLKQGANPSANQFPHHKCAPNSPNAYGFPALHWAVEVGNRKMVELLVRHGADLNLRSLYTGCGKLQLESPTPLFTAVDTNRPDMFLYLLELGADPHAQMT